MAADLSETTDNIVDATVHTADALLHELVADPRAGWTTARLTLALQAMITGFVIHQRVQPEDYDHARSSSYDKLSLFADSVLTFIIGVLDFTDARKTSRQELLERWDLT